VQNVLVLACSIRGGGRIPAFGLAMINQNFQNVYSLEAIRGNFSKISAAFSSLSYQVKYVTVNFQRIKYENSILFLIINMVVIVLYTPISCRQKLAKKYLFKNLRITFTWH
jgi:hypothetical protein